MRKIDSDFLSKGTRCAGTLYLPDEENPPVVVMAHGFAAERAFRLPAFAERFARRGIAAYLFDYRNFGDSDGEPRNLVSPMRHIQDWGAAISHVRWLSGVDGGTMALYGSSYGGGHVLVAAAKDRQVSAVVSQVPFVNGAAYLLQHTPKYFFQGLYHGARDLINMALFRPPHLVPVVGDPGAFACMNTPEAKPGYTSIIPEGSKWRNETPARAGITMAFYWPSLFASRIKCPVLMIAGENDTVVPYNAAVKTAGKIKSTRLVSLPVGHFEAYTGDMFEKVVEIEGEFLRETLLGG
jgi:pimeloyl-ACP methyl ester carboxylesterase